MSDTQDSSEERYFRAPEVNIYDQSTMPSMPPLDRTGQVSVSTNGIHVQRQTENIVRCENIVIAGQQGEGVVHRISETNDDAMRTIKLIGVYAEGETLPRNAILEKMIKKNFRSVILPDYKFVQTGKSFGSFEQPNLLDPNCVANRLSKMFPAIANENDEMKAKFWMTYRGVAIQFSGGAGG